MAERPLILISNDDGHHAPGIRALRRALMEIAEVVTVAPEREQSAKSHAISLAAPLRHREIEPGLHAIDGTPVDCVYVALFREGLLHRRPDLVLSGINHGPNLGDDIFYSGTVAAAREGAMRGIDAIALSSMARADEMDAMARIARDLSERVLELQRSAEPLRGGQPLLLNVNFPVGPVVGVRVTRLGRRHYADRVDEREDPRGRPYFWIGGPGGARHEPDEGSDTDAVDAGHVSITPLSIESMQPDHLETAAFVASGWSKHE
ncbi:MAG: 5'/3'-nucleotidase SurE [Myxococcales bacterium]|nr:5'/3'-nucleotidase SurE [Myxococcales bacterium]